MELRFPPAKPTRFAPRRCSEEAMIVSQDAPPASPETEDARIDEIVRSGPRGAVVVAGIATAIVIALWFAFYFMVFLPRGSVQ
jgi:hypothetical protein